MPLQFNQTKTKLSWTVGGQAFECDAWDSVEMPSALIAPSKKRGVPIDATPVAPEVRAARRVVDAKEEAGNSHLAALKKRAEQAEAEAKSARGHADDAQGKLEDLAAKLRESQSEAEALRRKLAEAVADRKAAEVLLSDTAKAATVAEERAEQAEAVSKEVESDTAKAATVAVAPKKRGRPRKG